MEPSDHIPKREVGPRLIHAWFDKGRTGTISDVVASLGLSKAGVAWQVERLREIGLIKAVGRRTILGQGKPPTIWAATDKPFPPPAPRPPRKKRVRISKPKILRQVDDEDDRWPLSKYPASAIVAQALLNRHPLDIAWSTQS